MLVLSTEKVNRYGYWVRTAGIRIDAYQDNPVLLWMHDMEGDSLPIGKLENIRVDELNRLVADPVFDEDDDFAMKCKRKYDKGMLSACSVNLDIYTLNDAPDSIKPGQKLASVWDSELLEVSMVKVPGNRDSVKLSAGEPGAVLPKINNQNEVIMDFKAIALELGVPDSSDEQAVLTAIKSLKEESAQAHKARVDAILAAAEAKGMRTAAFERMALSANSANLADLEQLVQESALAASTLDVTATAVTQSTLSARVKQQPAHPNNADDRANWSFDDYQRKDSAALLEMKRNEPDKYNQLATAYKPGQK